MKVIVDLYNKKAKNKSVINFSNIKFDRKVWKTANAETPTGPRQDGGDTLHRPSVNGGNISQNTENANKFRYSVRPEYSVAVDWPEPDYSKSREFEQWMDDAAEGRTWVDPYGNPIWGEDDPDLPELNQ